MRAHCIDYRQNQLNLNDIFFLGTSIKRKGFLGKQQKLVCHGRVARFGRETVTVQGIARQARKNSRKKSRCRFIAQ